MTQIEKYNFLAEAIEEQIIDDMEHGFYDLWEISSNHYAKLVAMEIIECFKDSYVDGLISLIKSGNDKYEVYEILNNHIHWFESGYIINDVNAEMEV
jgi:hypothetical protein